MTSGARLLALRLQGFKSFAERTTVAFGPGISAVVGPNGSGKSNLADALRWALGEQGRALRSRKAEDVIWAGSEKRPAQGMADVSLVIDNADGLLPVEYQVLELGRRLYRSGENDYLLNKTRIRLRDLVDLLDAAHLADNAFLFIGQGMVDQALALRPEERRPLFDEVAGVRRHERRRRRAEEQLIESAANLARVEDILGELRPQARRLAAQAEQQATRQSVADDLATALLQSMHRRWFVGAARVAQTIAEIAASRAEVDRHLATHAAAESTVADLARELASRAGLERDRAAALEAALAILNAARLRDARLASDLEARERDRLRLHGERAAAEAEGAAARRTLAMAVPPRDIDLEAGLAEAERALAGALEELAALRGAQQAHGQEQAAVRRAAAIREADSETARRRLAEAERQLTKETALLAAAAMRRAELEAGLTAVRNEWRVAGEAEGQTVMRRETARDRLAQSEATLAAAQELVVAAGAAAAAQRGQLDALETRLREEEERGIARAARRLGGRRVDEDLVIDPAFRPAVEAALADVTRAYVVGVTAVPALAGERGSLLTAEWASRPPATDDARDRAFRAAVLVGGGGILDAAVRRDPNGAASRWLARAAWLPDLAACLELHASLPPGWMAVPLDGSAVLTGRAITFGLAESVLERRSEAVRLTGALETLEAELRERRAAVARAEDERDAARVEIEAGQVAERRATAQRREAEEAERTAARQLETVIRELAWHEAQAQRLTADVARAGAVVASLPLEAAGPGPRDRAQGRFHGQSSDESGIAAWEARAVAFRGRRDRLAEDVAAGSATRRDVEHRRTRAEATLMLSVERLTRIEADLAALVAAERALTEQRDSLRTEIAQGTAMESVAREAIITIRTTEAADRDRHEAARHLLSATREHLRAADQRLRETELAHLEARLGLDAVREGLLVELAGLGAFGLARLAALTGEDVAVAEASAPGHATGRALNGESRRPVAEASGESEDVAALETALDRVAAMWALEPPAEPAPGPARLGQLRRRFHDLGAVNPYAVDEYATLKARLDSLETQALDLQTAIDRTQALIAELDAMIGDRFQTTFRALETAFARRFEQLFGGGFARLSLTDPSDVGASGIEIVARPPGKKPQALAMLSGGERALTAVALLFAMLEVRPVPFCVLDEVDAALDEANIGRFADALRGLADQTQVIVITHNRGTIEAADALYGVTSGDDSVSRVISLRLDEAQALAAVDRRELAPAG